MPQNNPNLGEQWGQEILQALLEHTGQDPKETHTTTLPAHNATTTAWPTWTHPELQQALTNQGIETPYAHQTQAAEKAWHHNHVVLATGTASGKTLAYTLPILTTLLQDPNACALYLTPTKALGADQLHNILDLCHTIGPTAHTINPAPYDGDTPTEARQHIRHHSRFIFSNPDMLHASILANHAQWTRLLRNLRYLVIDESHTYRGVFGAHIALVLRRLLRLARRYGSSPTVIFSSATSANPAEHASALLGQPVTAITEDGAPQGVRTVVLWHPPSGAEGNQEPALLMNGLILEGLRVLSFLRSRRAVEYTALTARKLLSESGRPDEAHRIQSYRGGYLPEERRKLETALDNGEIIGMASTNALELGIDIGGLDAVIVAGFPGSIASFWQQAGRAGRRGQGSLVIFIAREDPLDSYLFHHPETLLQAPIERNVFDPTNPHILSQHLLCALWEQPLHPAELAAFDSDRSLPLLEEFEKNGLARRRNQVWYPLLPPGETTPHSHMSLRGSGNTITIVEHTSGRILGTVDYASARSQVYPGAIYLHQGEHYEVIDLDLDGSLCFVEATNVEYRTEVRDTKDIRILPSAPAAFNPAPGIWVSNINVAVSDQVLGYQIKTFDGHVLAEHPLDMPNMVLETRAVAYTIDASLLLEAGIAEKDIPGALHAAEHAAIGILPLVATCDRLDLGGISTALHTDTQLPTVFVYDGHPHGAGFADCGYEHFAQWIAMTHDTVRDCPCEKGCPACIQSPKCGNGNEPLHKEGAITVLNLLRQATAPRHEPAPELHETPQ